MENNDEKVLKKLEKQYTLYINIIKFIVFVALFILIIFLFKFCYTYIIVSKLINANAGIDLGNNYKITMDISWDLNGKEEKKSVVTFYKDNIKIEESLLDLKNYYTPDFCYSVYDSPEGTKYETLENQEDYQKTTLWGSSEFKDEPSMKAIYVFQLIKSNVKIRHENLGKQKCLTLTLVSGNKFWFDNESLLFVKNENSTITTLITIEKNVVTDEDVKLPDLSKYEFTK